MAEKEPLALKREAARPSFIFLTFFRPGALFFRNIFTQSLVSFS